MHPIGAPIWHPYIFLYNIIYPIYIYIGSHGVPRDPMGYLHFFVLSNGAPGIPGVHLKHPQKS